MELDEGAFYLGLMAAAHRVPFYPTRAGLGRDMLTMNPSTQPYGPVPRPYADGEELVAIPAFELDVALIHMNRADHARQRSVPRARPVLRRLFAMGRQEDLHVAPSRSSPPTTSRRTARCTRRRSRGCTSRVSSRRRWARTSPSARPTTNATRRSSASTPRPPRTTRRGRRSRPRTSICQPRRLRQGHRRPEDA